MFSVVLFVAYVLTHPFHVSVSEIKYKEDKKVIQISSRIFLDDLEIALRSYSGNEKLDITKELDWNIIEVSLGKYILENLKVYNEKGELQTSYIGAEIEKDVMWVYVEIEKVKKLKTITVWNSILTDTFDDQENIIHFRAFEKVKSTRLYKGTEQKVFVWSE